MFAFDARRRSLSRRRVFSFGRKEALAFEADQRDYVAESSAGNLAGNVSFRINLHRLQPLCEATLTRDHLAGVGVLPVLRRRIASRIYPNFTLLKFGWNDAIWNRAMQCLAIGDTSQRLCCISK
ncbi:hypothetical protein [Croceicoccus naphthovorans]|uniref:hypothetical protein n=1 Tax=Croceicoccus naphthovorans TaxID=1348774 RepID=UPI0012E0B18B|nr:hypothetical protein [Croceicoccus naphthovorans]